jgi:heme-degrading monooxygenase HmoA
MVMERADLGVTPGREAEFETAMKRGCALLAGAAGCRSVSLHRCIERPSRYALNIEWDSIADHQSFTKTAEFQSFRELAGPFFGERPAVEHFQQILPSGT